MISFIMPVRNGEKFLKEALDPFLSIPVSLKWELIIIDDYSEDNTKSIIYEYKLRTDRIKYFFNTGEGKVQALNYGYSLSSGDISKFIDADDILSLDFFDYLDELKNHDAHCHDAVLISENLKQIGRYNVNPEILRYDYSYVLKNIVAIPRWSWSMKRDIAEKVFPMPDKLPFEDVWFSLLIKLHSKSLYHIAEPLYQYRQHANQTFGGILNYSKEAVNFRAKRILQLITELEKIPKVIELESIGTFDYIKEYYSLLKGEFNLSKILFSNLKNHHKIRAILLCFFPDWAKFITRLKWKLDSLSLSRVS